jgi:gas vesicle protein
MGNRDAGMKLAYLLVGFGAGVVLTLLFAPKSGKETRKFIAKKAGEGKEYVAAKGKELRKQTEELVGKGKELAGIA